MEDGELAFVVMNPRLVKADYSVDVDENVMNELDVKQEAELEVVCIVTIPRQDPKHMTINLLRPLIINAQSRCAVQVICDSQSYSHRYPVIQERQVKVFLRFTSMLSFLKVSGFAT